MRILFLGDIFGEIGCKIIEQNLFSIKENYKINFVIANAENCSNGKGLIIKDYLFLKNAGIDFFTMGNHTWAKEYEIKEILKNSDIVRPANLNEKFKYANDGVGTKTIKIGNKIIRITNLLGTSVQGFNKNLTNPFFTLDEIIKKSSQNEIHIIDFHAETTSEKNAFGIYFDGRVHAILGTHTHVPTNDLRISPKGTIYITDVGMCGPGFGSVIGAKAENAISRFLNPDNKFKLEVSNLGSQLNAVVLEFDDINNSAIACEQIRIINDSYEYLDFKI